MILFFNDTKRAVHVDPVLSYGHVKGRVMFFERQINFHRLEKKRTLRHCTIGSFDNETIIDFSIKFQN